MPEQWMRCGFKYLFVICVLVCSAGTVSAEWYKDYEAGIDLIRKGRHGEAIPRLQSAIAQKSQEGHNIKFYGMKFDDYFPHYYLGRAHFYQKNYQAAMKEFEISTSQGEIQRSRSLFQSLSELKTLASAQMNLNQPAPAPVIAEKKPEVVPPQQQQVEKQPETIVPEKTPPAQPVVREQPKKEAPVAVAKTETPAPAPPPPQPTAEELNIQRAKAHVKDGARRYFQGDFDSAIAAFSAALKLAPQDASAQFLLGCAYANKYLLSGASDQSAFQKASAAFQKIQRSAPNLPLTRSPLISPAVRDLYLKTGGA